MAIPIKGSRRIVVDGTAYRWRIRRKPTRIQADYACGSPLTFAVAPESPHGGTLHVSMDQPRPDNAFNQPRGSIPCSTVTPDTVARAIRRALAEGWQPECGGTFAIRWQA